jgi:hypothetical protein
VRGRFGDESLPRYGDSSDGAGGEEEDDLYDAEMDAQTFAAD